MSRQTKECEIDYIPNVLCACGGVMKAQAIVYEGFDYPSDALFLEQLDGGAQYVVGLQMTCTHCNRKVPLKSVVPQ